MKIAINVTSSKYRHCWQWIPLSSFLVVLPQTPAHLSAFEILFWSDLKLTQPSHSWHLSHSVSWAPRRGLSPHTHPYTASTALRDELRFLCYIRGEFRECLQHQGYVAHLSPLGRHLCRIQWWGTERRQVLSEPCISWHIKKKILWNLLLEHQLPKVIWIYSSQEDEILSGRVEKGLISFTLLLVWFCLARRKD